MVSHSSRQCHHSVQYIRLPTHLSQELCVYPVGLLFSKYRQLFVESHIYLLHQLARRSQTCFPTCRRQIQAILTCRGSSNLVTDRFAAGLQPASELLADLLASCQGARYIQLPSSSLSSRQCVIGQIPLCCQLASRSQTSSRTSSQAFTTPTSLNGGQQNFAGCLAVSWAGTLYIHFWRLLPLTEFCQRQNSLCVQVLRSPILAALLHGTRAGAVSQTLWRGTRNGFTELSQRAPPIFGWATINHVGHWPTFYFTIFS